MKRRDFSKMVMATAGMGSMLGAQGLMASDSAAASPAPTFTGPVTRDNRKAWAKAHFRGFENVVVGSFTQDLSQLDEPGLRLDIRKSIDHGFFSSLIAPAGQSHDELKRTLEVAVDEADGKLSIAFAVHLGDEDQQMDLIKHAEKVGCQHFLIDLPREGSQDELLAYLTKFTRMTNMGAYLWMAQVHDFQRFHPSAIPFELFDRAAEEPNVIALKVGNMDPAVLFELFERYNDKMLVGSLWPNIMPMAVRTYGQQWSGAWTVEALQSPETPYGTDFFNLLLSGEEEKAMGIYWSNVAPGFGAMMKLMGKYMAGGAHPWELIKYYQFLGGGNGGPMRVDEEHPDLPPLSAEDMGFVRGMFKKLRIAHTDLPDAAFKVGRVNWDNGVRG
jgi:4-hydroxy-tetrahydrodipicolinate synthase